MAAFCWIKMGGCHPLPLGCQAGLKLWNCVVALCLARICAEKWASELLLGWASYKWKLSDPERHQGTSNSGDTLKLGDLGGDKPRPSSWGLWSRVCEQTWVLHVESDIQMIDWVSQCRYEGQYFISIKDIRTLCQKKGGSEPTCSLCACWGLFPGTSGSIAPVPSALPSVPLTSGSSLHFPMWELDPGRSTRLGTKISSSLTPYVAMQFSGSSSWGTYHNSSQSLPSVLYSSE